MTEEDLRRNIEIDESIRRSVREVDLGAVLRAEGLTAVSLDGEGHVLRTYPDGNVTRLT